MSFAREKILQTAQKYVDLRQYQRAVREYQKLVHEDPNDARTLLKVGDLQSLMQAYPEAVATYDRVGRIYTAKGFSLKAIAVYKQICELIQKHAPQLADRYTHIAPKLAEIYAELGLTGDAIAAYDEVATRLQAAGRDREAVEVFRKMVEIDATLPLSHLRLAEACCRAESVDEAIGSFRTAADMLMNMNRPHDALKVFERILHFRQDPSIARLAAELHLRRADREGGLLALAKLQIAFEDNPNDLDTLGLLARAFAAIGQKDNAMEVCKEMARQAREQGRPDLHTEVLERLKTVAPAQNQVLRRELWRTAVSTSSQSAARLVDDAVFLDDDVEIVDDDVVVVDDEVEVLDDIEVIAEHSVVAEDSTETSTTTTRVFSLPNRVSSLPAPRPPTASSPDLLLFDDEVEITEERALPDSGDASSHTEKAIADAEPFRKLRLFSKALKILERAIELEPQSLPLRHKLREVLTEAGEDEAALQEAINIAIIHVDRSEGDLAEPLLYEVLEAAPEHEDALQLLEALTSDEDTVQRHAPLPDNDRQLPAYHGVAQSISSHGTDSYESRTGA